MSRLRSFLNNNRFVITILLTLSLASKVILFDQLTKVAVLDYFSNTAKTLEVTSFFNIILHYNKGISFGFLNDIAHANLILGLMVVAVIVAVWVWFTRNAVYINITPIGLITGGAIGNLIDRLTRQGVVDFLDFHYKNHHYPTFNVADAAIVLGVLMLMISGLVTKKDSL